MAGIKKIKLTADVSTENVFFYGLLAPVDDYKIVWGLNNNFFSFKKLDDFPNFFNPNDTETKFSMYYYNDAHHYMQFYLLANKNAASFLLPAFKNFDYIMVVKGNSHGVYFTNAIECIKNTKGVMFISPLDKSKIKQIDYLINDLEVHTINTESKDEL